MIFFTVLLSAFPLLMLILLPAILFTGAIEKSGEADFDLMSLVLTSGKMSVIIAVALSVFAALFVWVCADWIPLMKATFGV